ncbi:MAG: sulfurtransferase TusA family protein [Gammaproteobacteria bacterium]|nr:sulfurtransferase TusA family protein [Gammaproteobacteria bacterium]
MRTANILDTKGLLCPLPVIRLQEFVRRVESETEVTVVATDPGVLADIPSWCRVNGHELISTKELGREYHVTVRAFPPLSV